MGLALAVEAGRRGASVALVLGPTTLEPPSVGEVVRVRSAREMYAAVIERSEASDVVIMAAAVADYTPVGGARSAKVEKGGPVTLELERTVDILADLGRRRAGATSPVLVGFSASTGDPVAPSGRKLREKDVDLIVGNDVSAAGSGFDVDTNQVVLVTAAGAEPLPLLTKADVAAVVLDRVERLLASSSLARAAVAPGAS
jgi:phosphopantothenoylcysteine decarboxylase/phosphopantothenate--cysteine ligase